MIKLKEQKKIVLKRCYIDELGFSNLKGNGFEPNFNYYKNGDGNKICIKVEVPGNIDNIKSKIEFSGELTIINITGIKKKDKEPKNDVDILHNTREYGEFNLDIPLKTEDYHLVSNKKPQMVIKKGLIIIEYEFERKPEEFEYQEKD